MLLPKPEIDVFIVPYILHIFRMLVGLDLSSIEGTWRTVKLANLNDFSRKKARFFLSVPTDKDSPVNCQYS